MERKINLAMTAAMLLAFFTLAYGNNIKGSGLSRVPDFLQYGTFAKGDAVLAPQPKNGQSTCMEAVPIVNAAAEDNYGAVSRYSNQANILYYDYFAPVGSIVDGFAYAGCQQFNDCMYNYNDSYLILGRNDWSETCDWYNNFEDCESITKCTGEPVDSNDRMAFVVINPLNESVASHGMEFSISSVRGDDTFGGYNYDASAGTTHVPVSLPPMAVNSVSCDSYNCNVEVSIPNLAFDPSGNSGGLYGDDPMIARNLVAGYKIYAARAEQAPVTGRASNWTMNIVSGRHLARGTGLNATATVVVDITSGSGNLYLSYAPVFNYYNACLTDVCTDAEILAIDNATSGHLVSPYLAPNTLAAGDSTSEKAVISSMEANAEKKKVTVTWTTSLEQNVDGFRLYRTFDQTNWILITKTLIPASNNPKGASYSFVESLSPKLKTVLYKVQAIGLSGAVLDEKETQLKTSPVKSLNNF